MAATEETSTSLLSWGNCGQQRCGFTQTGASFVSRPQFINVPSMVGNRISALAAGKRHSLIVSASDGCLFGVGDNSSGQLGMLSKPSINEFSSIDMPTGTYVLSVAAGYTSSYAVTGSRKVYSWGDGTKGQLGQGDFESSHVPRIVGHLGKFRIKMVAAGSFHAIALSLGGAVYSWGFNKYGQLGHGNTESCALPVRVSFLTGCVVTQVAAGDEHSCALGNTLHGRHFGTAFDKNKPEQAMFTWGDNKHGQLGQGHRQASHLPVHVTRMCDKLITSISSGSNHIMCLTDQNQVYLWGHNKYGQLGLGDVHDRLIPRFLEGFSNCVRISAGARHSLATDSRGCVHAWGYNWFGELGLGDRCIRLMPQPILNLSQSVKVDQIECGSEHSLATVAGDDEGALLCFLPELKETRMNITSESGRTVRREGEVDGYAYVALAGPGVTKQRYRWNVVIDRINTDMYDMGIGVSTGSEMEPFIFDPLDQFSCWLYLVTAKQKLYDGVVEEYGELCVPGDVVSVEVDRDQATVRFFKNDADLGVAYYINSQEPLYLCVSLTGETDQVTVEDPEEFEDDVLELDEGLLYCYNEIGAQRTTGIEAFYECMPCGLMICRACARKCHRKHRCEPCVWKGVKNVAACECGDSRIVCEALDRLMPEEIVCEGKEF